MAIIIKTSEQIRILREAGEIHRRVLDELVERIEPGMNAKELDRLAEKLVRSYGAEPAFLGYRPDASYPKYPASLCVSVNEVVVHGIPAEDVIFREGDLVSLDFGVKYRGLYVDAARSLVLGGGDERLEKLVSDAYEGLRRGIEVARAGNHVGDIGHAVSSVARGKYGIVRELSGHGVGVKLHEDPYVPNYGIPGKGELLRPGMVIAIEPMFNLGTAEVVFHADQYTVTTADGKPSAHVEHTVLITEEEPEVLT